MIPAQTYTDDPREVPARITRLSQIGASRALELAYWNTLGQGCPKGTLAVLLAQTALETGRWKSIWCHNFGNQKASANYRGNVCFFRCNEVLNGKIEWFDPPHPQTRFRAYPTPEAGAADYIRFLAVDTNGDGHNRYAKTWAAAERGDPEAFTVEAKRAGYFTASLALYQKAMLSLFAEFRAWLDEGYMPAAPQADEPPKRSPASDPDLELVLPMLPFEPDWDAMHDERTRAVREMDD